jgi:predicted metal-binding protein
VRERARRRTIHLLHICTRCRRPGTAPGAASTDGRRLFDEVEAQLAALPDPPAIRLNGIDCMSGCNRSCTIAVAAPGKPTYLFGDLLPEPGCAAQIIDLARLYRESEDGVLLRASRPPALRSGILARIPGGIDD